ncbi:hypothetical protein F7Q99_30200 [Streptomyces kaniharaensis]|uniref:Transcriptional repressor n=1 Tax=Streptomyces kaniharaensis TaxID=212423 RepID=A0A6N7L3F9_9ACTN|nr:transcriptional repressor [Streptomyces kaniharaensis]MQS16363.1 hypothetical protein [Streptomyces kaniharaensis]
MPYRGGEATYGLAGDHQHAVCSSCGAVEEIPVAQLVQAVSTALRATAFRLESLVLSGLCSACQQA